MGQGGASGGKDGKWRTGVNQQYAWRRLGRALRTYNKGALSADRADKLGDWTAVDGRLYCGRERGTRKAEDQVIREQMRTRRGGEDKMDERCLGDDMHWAIVSGVTENQDNEEGDKWRICA
ncbi:hypothetical protein PHYPSEUDO_015317 [Phytophthora pseudosyringae]|uniref:Uncharacterized protein n=1 Tax=Phytophthora pseudosyringae TaxID=221518 RepID=A0A8T1VYZ7_9STRA|nr:hypothetical protein PHYPSEUDO_015317 [Phytophthora pseudosyringae]